MGMLECLDGCLEEPRFPSQCAVAMRHERVRTVLPPIVRTMHANG